MQLTMPVVWSDDCRLHDPAAEIWIGVRTPAVETAARTDAILEALRAAGGHTVPAEQHEDGRLLAVHDSGSLEYLASAWADWEQAGLPVDPGQGRVVRYVFAHSALRSSAVDEAGMLRAPAGGEWATRTSDRISGRSLHPSVARATRPVLGSGRASSATSRDRERSCDDASSG